MARLEGLVARFKKAIDEEDARAVAEATAQKVAGAAAAKVPADAKKRKSAALRARKELIAEITALANAIGLSTDKKKGSLTLAYRGRTLTLDAADADRLDLVFDGAAPGENIALEDNGEWTITRVIGGFGRNQTLLEGLEDLLVDALHLPHPDGKAPVVPAHTSEPIAKKAKKKPTGKEIRAPTVSKKKPVATPGGVMTELSNPWD